MSDIWNLSRTCPQFRRLAASQATRRGFLHAGVVGTAGLPLSQLLRAEAAAASKPVQERAKNNVIILWMRGGPSHIDMWDTKPDAPAEFRGEFGTINTNVAGIQLTDMLPMC